MKLTCSIPDCQKELFGTAVMLRDTDEPDSDRGRHWIDEYKWMTYDFMLDDGSFEYVAIIHTACWERLFRELMLIEGRTVLTFSVAPIGEIADIMGLTVSEGGGD